MSTTPFSASVRSEVRKVTSTKLWWIMLAGMAGYMAFLAVVMAFSLATAPEDVAAVAMSDLAIAQSVYTLAPALGYVFPLVMGALAVTGEFRHRTITPTLLAEPSRGRVLGAKLVVQAGQGALLGLVGTAAVALAGAGSLAAAGAPVMLGESAVWANLAWSVVALALWGVIGVGVGTLVTNQVASVVMILAFTQFVEPILRMALGAVDAIAWTAKFLPGAAAEALVGSSLYSATGMMELLDRWQGGLVLLAYALVLAGIGRFTTMRRDVS